MRCYHFEAQVSLECLPCSLSPTLRMKWLRCVVCEDSKLGRGLCGRELKKKKLGVVDLVVMISGRELELGNELAPAPRAF